MKFDLKSPCGWPIKGQSPMDGLSQGKWVVDALIKTYGAGTHWLEDEQGNKVWPLVTADLSDLELRVMSWQAGQGKT